MKKAISFSGQSRFVKQGYETLRNNLEGFEDYDIFVHSWSGPLEKDIQLYKPLVCKIEPQKHVVPSIVKEYSDAHFVHFSMFYTMKESLNAVYEWEKKNSFKYDLIIRTRFDISLEGKINPSNFDLKEGIYSPDVCANPKVISDWFNFGNSETMKVYTEMYDNIINFHKEGVMITSGEEIITHMLKVRNIPIIKVPCELYLLRDKNIHKTLSSFWKYAN